ncbi:hypothetical protein DFJ73DRAFT_902301 [Zopfochytrium polystomum]|nr:hypothetical protein DFJ73DRAFT_902301 [Zopfochytrium polystomum]
MVAVRSYIDLSYVFDLHGSEEDHAILQSIPLLFPVDLIVRSPACHLDNLSAQAINSSFEVGLSLRLRPFEMRLKFWKGLIDKVHRCDSALINLLTSSFESDQALEALQYLETYVLTHLETLVERCKTIPIPFENESGEPSLQLPRLLVTAVLALIPALSADSVCQAWDLLYNRLVFFGLFAPVLIGFHFGNKSWFEKWIPTIALNGLYVVIGEQAPKVIAILADIVRTESFEKSGYMFNYLRFLDLRLSHLSYHYVGPNSGAFESNVDELVGCYSLVQPPYSTALDYLPICGSEDSHVSIYELCRNVSEQRYHSTFLLAIELEHLDSLCNLSKIFSEQMAILINEKSASIKDMERLHLERDSGLSLWRGFRVMKAVRLLRKRVVGFQSASPRITHSQMHLLSAYSNRHDINRRNKPSSELDYVAQMLDPGSGLVITNNVASCLKEVWVEAVFCEDSKFFELRASKESSMICSRGPDFRRVLSTDIISIWKSVLERDETWFGQVAFGERVKMLYEKYGLVWVTSKSYYYS